MDLNDVEINDVDEELEAGPEGGSVIGSDNVEKAEDGSETSAAANAPPVILQRKDKSLKEFLGSMDEYAPIIPDAVTDYYLAKAGFETNDRRIKRLLALATQKFISDIATDAYQYSRIRSASSVSSASNPQARARALMAGAQGNVTGGSGASGASGTGAAASSSGQGKLVLTMEDLGNALAEYGLNVKKPDFYR